MGDSLFLIVNDVARHTPWLHLPIKLYAAYGVAIFAGLMVLGWWYARKDANPARMAAALWTPLGMIAALAIAQPISSLVAERRPFVVLHHILVLTEHSANYGFPSDHATMAGAVAAGMLLVHKRLGIATVIAALFMAFARVYVAVHYPQDVLGGLVLGATVVLIGYALFLSLFEKAIAWCSHTRLRPLVTAPPDGPAVARGTELPPNDLSDEPHAHASEPGRSGLSAERIE